MAQSVIAPVEKPKSTFGFQLAQPVKKPSAPDPEYQGIFEVLSQRYGTPNYEALLDRTLRRLESEDKWGIVLAVSQDFLRPSKPFPKGWNDPWNWYLTSAATRGVNQRRAAEALARHLAFKGDYLSATKLAETYKLPLSTGDIMEVYTAGQQQSAAKALHSVGRDIERIPGLGWFVKHAVGPAVMAFAQVASIPALAVEEAAEAFGVETPRRGKSVVQRVKEVPSMTEFLASQGQSPIERMVLGTVGVGLDIISGYITGFGLGKVGRVVSATRPAQTVKAGLGSLGQKLSEGTKALEVSGLSPEEASGLTKYVPRNLAQRAKRAIGHELTKRFAPGVPAAMAAGKRRIVNEPSVPIMRGTQKINEITGAMEKATFEEAKRKGIGGRPYGRRNAKILQMQEDVMNSAAVGAEIGTENVEPAIKSLETSYRRKGVWMKENPPADWESPDVVRSMTLWVTSKGEGVPRALKDAFDQLRDLDRYTGLQWETQASLRAQTVVGQLRDGFDRFAKNLLRKDPQRYAELAKVFRSLRTEATKLAQSLRRQGASPARAMEKAYDLFMQGWRYWSIHNFREFHAHRLAIETDGALSGIRGTLVGRGYTPELADEMVGILRDKYLPFKKEIEDELIANGLLDVSRLRGLDFRLTSEMVKNAPAVLDDLRSAALDLAPAINDLRGVVESYGGDITRIPINELLEKIPNRNTLSLRLFMRGLTPNDIMAQADALEAHMIWSSAVEGKELKFPAASRGVSAVIRKTPQPLDTAIARAIHVRTEELGYGLGTKNLARDLEQMGMLRETGSPGYSMIPPHKSFGDLAGKYVPTPLRDEIVWTWAGREVARVTMYTKATNIFKFGKTIASPPTHANNAINNMLYLAYVGGGLPPTRIDIWHLALKEMRHGGRYYDEAFNSGLFSGRFVESEFHFKPVYERLTPAERTFRAYTMPLRKAYSVMANAYQFSENWAKMAVYIWHRMHGATPEAATMAAKFAIFDYADLPPIMRSINKYFPFTSFTYKSMTQFARVAASNPERILSTVQALAGVNRLNYERLNPDERKALAYAGVALAERVAGVFPLSVKPSEGQGAELSALNLSGVFPIFEWGRPEGPMGAVTPFGTTLFPADWVVTFLTGNNLHGVHVYDPNLLKQYLKQGRNSEARGEFLKFIEYMGANFALPPPVSTPSGIDRFLTSLKSFITMEPRLSRYGTIVEPWTFLLYITGRAPYRINVAQEYRRSTLSPTEASLASANSMLSSEYNKLKDRLVNYPNIPHPVEERDIRSYENALSAVRTLQAVVEYQRMMYDFIRVGEIAPPRIILGASGILPEEDELRIANEVKATGDAWRSAAGLGVRR